MGREFQDFGAVPVPISGDKRNYISQPYVMSDDGSVVGGDSGGVNDKGAMIWTSATGMVHEKEYEAMNGVTNQMTWRELTKTVYISPDRRTMVGYGFKGTSPSLSTWIVKLK